MSDESAAQPSTETTLLHCGTCGSPVRFLTSPDGIYEGPWDMSFEVACASSECGQVIYVEYPTMQSVRYKRAESLAPLVELL